MQYTCLCNNALFVNIPSDSSLMCSFSFHRPELEKATYVHKAAQLATSIMMKSDHLNVINGPRRVHADAS